MPNDTLRRIFLEQIISTLEVLLPPSAQKKKGAT